MWHLCYRFWVSERLVSPRCTRLALDWYHLPWPAQIAWCPIWKQGSVVIFPKFWYPRFMMKPQSSLHSDFMQCCSCLDLANSLISACYPSIWFTCFRRAQKPWEFCSPAVARLHRSQARLHTKVCLAKFSSPLDRQKPLLVKFIMKRNSPKKTEVSQCIK